VYRIPSFRQSTCSEAGLSRKQERSAACKAVASGGSWELLLDGGASSHSACDFVPQAKLITRAKLGLVPSLRNRFGVLTRSATF
jgi:hypothetical protein